MDCTRSVWSQAQQRIRRGKERTIVPKESYRLAHRLGALSGLRSDLELACNRLDGHASEKDLLFLSKGHNEQSAGCRVTTTQHPNC